MRATFGIRCAVLAAVAAVLGGPAPAADPTPAQTPRVEFEGKVFAAFQRAVKEKKLLVVYFRNDYCARSKGPCKHCLPVDAILTGKAVGELKDKAVWVWQSVDRDDSQGNVAKLMGELKIDAVPAVVVLKADTTELKELGRVTGNVQEAEMVKRLKVLLGE